MSARFFTWPVVLLIGGCSATGGATFSGVREPVLVRPDGIGRSEAVPSGYERLGRVMARCEPIDGFGALDGESLANVDCSRARLERALEEAAAEVGGELLVGLHCRSPGGALRCEAGVARPSERLLSRRSPVAARVVDTAPAPGPSEVVRLDEPLASRAWGIQVDFEPRLRAFSRPARPYSAVTSVERLPPAQLWVGDVLASCDRRACSDRELAHALRVTAARLGADTLAGVHCTELEDERQCSASLGADPYDVSSVAAAR